MKHSAGVGGVGASRGVVVGVVALALLASLLAAPVPAQGAQTCPVANFADRTAIPEVHRGNVDCAAEAGITRGYPDGTYRPTLSVPRDQMAAFVARTLDAAGVALPAAALQGFTDTAGNTHAGDIGRLAAAGIVAGTSPTTFSPGQLVRRDQAASFVLRAYAYAQDRDLAEVQGGGSPFTDIAGNAHQPNIEGAYQLDLIRGRDATTYAPEAGTRRDQKATLLVRLLHALDDTPGSDPGEDDTPGSDPGEDDTPGSDPGEDDAPGSDGDLFGTPDPLNVTVATDAARGVSTTLDPAREDATVLTTAGADGTVYTLTVPADSITARQAISMTPISGIDGSPFAAPPVGVELLPHGLDFPAGATLSMQLPTAPDPAGFTGFDAYAGGTDFHLRPATVDGRTVTIDLAHFSYPGGATATPAEVAAQAERVPSRAEAAFHQAAQTLVHQLFADLITTEEFGAQYTELMLRMYDEVLKPMLIAGLDSDEAGRAANQAFLGWGRVAALLGFDDDPGFPNRYAEGFDLVLQIVANAYERASERCLAHDLTAVRDMLAHARLLELLGAGDLIDFFAEITDCTRFELDMESETSYQTSPEYLGGDVVAYNDVVATVPLALDLGHGTHSGEADVEYTRMEFDHPDCVATGIGFEMHAPMRVHGLGVDLQPNPDDSSVPPKVSMTFEHAVVNERIRWSCGGGSSSESVYANWWTTIREAYRPYRVDPDGALLAFGPEEWQYAPPGGEVVATIQHDLAGVYREQHPYTAAVSYTLRHAPLGSGD